MRRLVAALLLLAAPARAVDGGIEAIWATCPDAPLAVAIDGGHLLTDARAQRLECKLASCRAYADGLEEQVSLGPGAPVLVVALVGAAALVLGAGLGVIAGRLTK